MSRGGRGPGPLRVVVGDDSGIFRQGLVLLLEATGVDVAASVPSATALLQAVAAHRPDVAILDVRMPPTHTDEGLRAALDLHQNHPGVGVLMLSTYVEPRWALTLLDAFSGGIGYLLKDRVDDVTALLGALGRVADGGVALDPEVVTSLLLARRRASPLQRLSPRELEVLALLAEGRSNAGIAESLFLSLKTVEGHVASAFRGLGLAAEDGDNRRVKAALAFLANQTD